jgi:hypothetical protein
MSAKILLRFLVIISFLGACLEATGQSDVALATRATKLKALSNSLMQRDAADRQKTQAFAHRTGIPARRELPGGKILELQRFSETSHPIFYITNNLDAADTVSTLKVWPGGSAGLDLDGSGMTVGEWDGGKIYAHTDFIGRLTQMDDATEVSGHSTHVAGTLIGAGDGLEPRSRGMAYAAQLNAWDWNSDTAEMAAAAADGLLTSNHSYGIAAGWLYIGGGPPDTWWWIGGAADTDVEDPYFGYYDNQSQLWDQIAFDAPYYLIVKAAGNDRSDTGPPPGEEYTVIDQEGNPLFTSTLPRNFDCAPAGYDCLPTNSVAKNVLTVGAVDDVPGGYSALAGPSQVQMAPFSSWGPTDDGRIKPDVVGNGVFLISAWPDSPFYAAAAGTSMAAPNVTGSLLLLQEHYEDIHGVDSFMRSATLKALAIHTADEAGGDDGPDYAFGWGLINTRLAAKVISEDGGGDHRIIEGSLADGAEDTYQFNVATADSVLSATFVWMDPPGTPVALALDAPDPMLVNDLDLRITRSPSTYMPWVLNPAVPSAAATTGDNFRDNVEQVVVTDGGTGTYTISISHKGTLLNGISQNYSLIISVLPAPPTGSGLLIDEDFSGGMPAGWSVDTVMGIPWTINSPVPGDSRLNNGTGGSGKFAIVDSNYGNTTVTSLRTPTMDLSSASAAVLRFKSYYNYDFLESLNVDVSTNGGLLWSNAWLFQGFNPLPTLYTLDLSGAIAGHASVMLRFRFDSENWIDGDFWQIDDVELDVFGATPPPGDPPGQATGPSPADASNGHALSTTLSWSAGSLATSHDVYFGTDSTPDPSESQGNQTGSTFDPGTLLNSTTYYWRVDEVNAEGTTTGSTWSFTTEVAPVPPGPASSPSPANGETNVNINANLGWTAGSDTTSHDVYFNGALQGNQAGTSIDPGMLAYDTTYNWRVDEVNAEGKTPGSTWSFTTEPAPTPAGTINLNGLAGSMTPGSHGRWNAIVEVSIEDQYDSSSAGVTVDGNWSNGANGSGQCITDGAGLCSVAKNNMKKQVTSVTFTITNLTKPGSSYSPADNVGSNSIIVSQSSVDKTPSATDDSYQTDIDVPLSDNVISNDNQGDGPASINSNSLPSNGSLSMPSDGSFTYTPNSGFDGADSFDYNIIDQDGDISGTATVTITVSADPPLPTDDPTVNLLPYKVKGLQHVDVTWANFTGATVTITRNGIEVDGSPANNDDGSLTDNIGSKGGGQYTYDVCETVSSVCISADTGF